MTVTGLVSLVLVLSSLGFLRNFCVQYIIKYSSRFILRIMGFTGVFPALNEFSKDQVLYTFNHNSYLDIFLLTGLGVPNLRFVLSEKVWVYIPLIISAMAIGTRFIPQKKSPKRRRNFFKYTTRFLKETKYSIAASAEGVHEHFHGIAPFNQGIFLMALEARLNIVPLYIHIPRENNMFKTEYAKGGVVEIELMNPILTDNWSLENIDAHIDEVRTIFTQRFNALNPIQE